MFFNNLLIILNADKKTIMKKSITVLSLFLFACAAALLPSCKKDKTGKGVLKINIAHLADTIPLVFHRDYQNSNGETINITKFNYYISGITIIADDGKNFSEPLSYRLITQGDSVSRHFQVVSIPANTYTGIQFTIGINGRVDSLNLDDLNPLNGMFWNDSIGYYAAKMEGTSPQSVAIDNAFKYYIAGYTGPNAGTRTISFSFPSPIKITENSYNTLNFTADALKWFSGANTILVSKYNNVVDINDTSKKIADNYASMFKLISVQ